MPKRPTTPHRTLGAFIASERLRAGLTQQDVAAALDQPQQWLSRIESGGQRVNVVELLALAQAIGFEFDEAVRVVRRSGASSSRRRPPSPQPPLRPRRR